MKKIRVEDWKIIAYIENQDVEFLFKTREVVPTSFFEEDAVLKGECSDDGFYRITDINSVNYIKSAPFILNQDRLEKSSLKDLEAALKNASYSHNKLLEFLQKLYSKEKLEQNQLNEFNSLDIMMPSMAKEIMSVAYSSNNEPEERRFIVLEDALRLQSDYYLKNLSDYVASKKKTEKANRDKVLFMRRFFKPKL